MRAIIVAVNYPVIRETLPYNRHHFEDVMIVTSHEDSDTIEFAKSQGVKLHVTDAFTRYGAWFNKYLALEEGLSRFGRHGWLWILDADIFIPKKIDFDPRVNLLYSPHRFMAREFQPESKWLANDMGANTSDFLGYSQIFHADDRHLPNPPWHDCRWIHGGGGDMQFQELWPAGRRRRCSFPVLHVGDASINWAGTDEESKKKLRKILLVPGRRGRGYEGERIELPPDYFDDFR